MFLMTTLLGSKIRLAWRTSIKFAQIRHYTNRNVLRLAEERGLFTDIFPNNSNELAALLTKSPQTIYAGFDPTADGLHVGNLLVVIALLHCQRAGHRIIALIGGSTALVGDPSGRTTERDPIDDPKVVHHNSLAIESTLRRIFANHEQYFWKPEQDSPLLPPIIVNNSDWHSKTSIVDFLSTVGRHFRMGTMLLKESVQSRLKSPEGMSLTEFTYQVFQSYDWHHLFQKYDCRIQIGGVDQTGNISAGHNFIRRFKKEDVFGLMVPLVKSTTGEKLGKTAGHAVWLNEHKTSPFDLYQYFVRFADLEIENYLKLFSFLPVANIISVMENHKENPEARKPQKLLAELVTRLVHGEEGLKSAKRTTRVLYETTPENLALLSESELRDVFSQATCVTQYLKPGTTVLEMALAAKCFRNEDDARRIIDAGGFSINYRKVTQPDYVLILGEHILPNYVSLVRVGRKHYYVVKWTT